MISKRLVSEILIAHSPLTYSSLAVKLSLITLCNIKKVKYEGSLGDTLSVDGRRSQCKNRYDLAIYRILYYQGSYESDLLKVSILYQSF